MALAAREVVDGKARFGGRTLAEWVPEAVDVLVRAIHPVSILLFGSVARGEDGPESDIDFLLVVDDDADRHAVAKAAVRAVARLGPEVDVVVAPLAAVRAKKDVAGTVIRPALREGRKVYSRAG